MRKTKPRPEKGKTEYTPETKAAVLAALLAGQGASKVAEEFRLPEGTVKSWQSRLRQAESPLRRVAPEKADEIGDLLIGYLHANLETLKIQATFFQDTKWLSQQNAADVAVLHGVMTDKSIRLLEALGGPAKRA